jgi:hypothetical protein
MTSVRRWSGGLPVVLVVPVVPVVVGLRQFPGPQWNS